MDLVLGPENLSVPFRFTIPTHNRLGNEIKRVGVFSSGGLDSTALLCLILSDLKDTGRLNTIPVTAFTIVKGEGSTYYSERVVDKLSKYFGVTINHQNNLENNEPAYSEGRIGIVPIRETYHANKHDMDIYQGNNRMAPGDIRPFKHTLKMFYPDEQVLYKAPFLVLHKPQIVDLYYKLGCEDIIPWTHSCTVHAVGKCDDCYSCSEKVWAFDALGKEYVDTIPPDIEDVSFGGTWRNTTV
jgi:hypothetical protein